MECPRCGKENRASRTVCLGCGHQLKGSEAPEKSPQPYAVGAARCDNCGSYVKEGARFCTECGQPADGNVECPECRSRVGAADRYCAGCGRVLRPAKVPKPSSKPVAALVLGLVPGLLSLWGIGHIFAGRINRGLAFLVLGLAMTVVAPVALIFLAPDMGGLLVLSVLGAVAWVVLWLYQSIDAYRMAGGD